MTTVGDACSGDFWSMKKGLSGLWRIFKSMLKVTFFIAVAVILAAVGWDMQGSVELKAARERAAALGIRLSMDEIVPARTGLDERQNAANYYEAAVAVLCAQGAAPKSDYVPLVSRALYNRSRPDSGDEKLKQAAEDLRRISDDPRIPLPDYMLAAAKDYVSEHQQVVDLVGQGARLESAWYHVSWQGYKTLLPHLTGLREAARLMQLAAWVDVEENRPSAAVQKVRDSLAMARSLRTEPSLISSLVEMAIVSITVQGGLARTVARAEIPGEDLLALQKDVETLAGELSLAPALEGECAGFCDHLDSVMTGKIALADALPGIENAPPFAQIAKALPVRLLTGYIKSDEALGIAFFVSDIERAGNLVPGTVAQPNPFEKALMEHPFSHVFSSTHLPGMTRALLQGELTRARLRAAAAALAALRYQRDTGDWPETLDALVPAYIAAVPVDPVNGGPLVYRVRTDGLVIYSVGENGIDDGGTGYVLSTGSDRGDDFGFRVFR